MQMRSWRGEVISLHGFEAWKRDPLAKIRTGLAPSRSYSYCASHSSAGHLHLSSPVYPVNGPYAVASRHLARAGNHGAVKLADYKS